MLPDNSPSPSLSYIRHRAMLVRQQHVCKTAHSATRSKVAPRMREVETDAKGNFAYIRQVDKCMYKYLARLALANYNFHSMSPFGHLLKTRSSPPKSLKPTDLLDYLPCTLETTAPLDLTHTRCWTPGLRIHSNRNSSVVEQRSVSTQRKTGDK
jgi:hypothetical protein